MNNYRTDAPQILRDFLSYHETVKAHSQRTVDEYFLDLRKMCIRDRDIHVGDHIHTHNLKPVGSTGEVCDAILGI